MWGVARFGSICKIQKYVKNTHGGVFLLVNFQVTNCNFTKSNTPLRVFFTYFLNVQMIPNCAKHLTCRSPVTIALFLKKTSEKGLTRSRIYHFYRELNKELHRLPNSQRCSLRGILSPETLQYS